MGYDERLKWDRSCEFCMSSFRARWQNVNIVTYGKPNGEMKPDYMTASIFFIDIYVKIDLGRSTSALQKCIKFDWVILNVLNSTESPGSNWCFSFAPELVGYSAPRDLHRRVAYSICESWFFIHQDVLIYMFVLDDSLTS